MRPRNDGDLSPPEKVSASISARRGSDLARPDGFRVGFWTTVLEVIAGMVSLAAFWK